MVAALGEWTQRQVRDTVTAAVDLLVDGGLEKWVRPWDVAGLRAGAEMLGEVSSATAVHLDEVVLVAELRPAARRIALRRIEHGWRRSGSNGPQASSWSTAARTSDRGRRSTATAIGGPTGPAR